jgi:hypothetical protein
MRKEVKILISEGSSARFVNCAYCDMTSESGNGSLLGNGSVNRSVKMNTHATTELSFLCSGEVNTPL